MLVAIAGLLTARSGFTVNEEVSVNSVPFERSLRANQEPRGYSSQRYSELKQITAENVKNLALQWSFHSNSREKHEVTPLVVDGVMYSVQSVNDVIALHAATGEVIWTYSHKPDPNARNRLCSPNCFASSFHPR